MTKKRIKNQSKKKSSVFRTPLIVLGLITLAVTILYSFPKPQKSDIFEVGAPGGTVALSLAAPSPTLTLNTTYTLTLGYGSATEHLTAIQAVIHYDPDFITVTSVTPGSDFPTTLQTADLTTAGVIKLAYGVLTTSTGLTGTGTVATIAFSPIKTGNTSFNFTDQTLASTLEHGNTNAIQTVANPALTIVDPAASPSPSPSASADPSLPASTAPSIPASAAPSIPATPQKPAKPTGLRSNCYGGGNKITLRWDAVSGVTSYKLRVDQKDGSNDKSADGVNKTDYDTSIIPDQKYSWWVHSTKDGVDSEEARIDEVVCPKTSTSTPTPTPTPKPTVTPKPSLKASVKPSTKASVKPTASPARLTSPSPTSIGSLNDVFTTPPEEPVDNETKIGLFQKIALGWQTLFQKIFDALIGN